MYPIFRPSVRCLLTLLLLVVAGGTMLSGCARKSPEALLVEARDYAAKQDYRMAAIQLRTLLKREPDNVEGLVMLADVSLAGNNPARAERNYRRAAALGVDPSRVWAGWMEALLQLGRYDEVLAQSGTPAGSRQFTDPKENARQSVFIGRALLGLARRPEAEAAFRNSLQVAPSAPAHLELARLLAATERPDEANRELDAALAVDPTDAEALLMQGMRLLTTAGEQQSLPVLTEALKRSQTQNRSAVQASALGTLAELDLAAGRFDAAGERAAALGKLVGNQPDVRYLRARIALEQKDLERAKTELQEILASRKDYAPAQRLLGAIYTLENQYDLAEMFLRPVVAADPNDLFARRLLATVHLARNRPAEALPLLDNVTAPDAESRQALMAMRGQASLQLGDVARAISVFREGSKAYPDNPVFELGLGLTMLAEGRTDEAQEVLRQVRGAEADATRAAFLSIVYMQKGQTENALQSARSVVEKFPGEAWSHNLLGSILLSVGQFAEARVELTRAVELDPKDAAALGNLARTEELLGDPAAAAVVWQRILERDPANADAAFWLARLQLDQGNISQALAVLGPFQKTSTRAQLLVGSILLDRGATSEVRELATTIARAEPKNPEAWNLLGLADLSTGAVESAIGNFRSAVEFGPNRALYQVNLARAYLVAGNDEAAAAAIKAAGRIDPDLLQLRSLEFLRLARQGKTDEARRVLAAIREAKLADEPLSNALEAELLLAEKNYAPAATLYASAYAGRPSLDLAVKTWSARRAAGSQGDVKLLLDWQQRHPDDPRAMRALADAYLADGNLPEAEIAYEKVLRLVKDDLATLNNLAWLYQERGDKRALMMGDRAAELAPDSAPILDTAGWAHLRLGDRQRGLKLIRRAADLAPTDRDIQYHLAVGLVDSGQLAEGKRVLSAILRTGETFASRPAAEKMLRQM